MLPLHPFFLASDANGQVWRVAPDGQSKVATEGFVLFIDQWYLAEIGADSEIKEYSQVHAWLMSVPTVVA